MPLLPRLILSCLLLISLLWAAMWMAPPVGAVNMHIGTGRALLVGKNSGGGGPTGNALLVNTGLPMFSQGTTPILVQ